MTWRWTSLRRSSDSGESIGFPIVLCECGPLKSSVSSSKLSWYAADGNISSYLNKMCGPPHSLSPYESDRWKNPGKAQITTQVQLKEHKSCLHDDAAHIRFLLIPLLWPPSRELTPLSECMKRTWLDQPILFLKSRNPGIIRFSSLGPVQCDVEWSKQYVAGIHQWGSTNWVVVYLRLSGALRRE